MSIADEIQKLHELQTKGALSQVEFEQAKSRLLGGESTIDRVGESINRLRLSESDRWIAGVCGGIAQSTGVESWVWRLIFVLGLAAGGFTALLYAVLWIFVPREPA